MKNKHRKQKRNQRRMWKARKWRDRALEVARDYFHFPMHPHMLNRQQGDRKEMNRYFRFYRGLWHVRWKDVD